MNTISLPSCEILMPRFEIPRFLRNLKDDTLARMMQQRTNSKNIQAGNRGIVLSQGGAAAVNPLASVPWVAQWKMNGDLNDSVGVNHLTNNNSVAFTTGKLGGATGAAQFVAASSQYGSIADNAALSMGDLDFTIAFWFYLNSLGTLVMVNKCQTPFAVENHEYQIAIASSRLRFLVGNGATIGLLSANTFGDLSTATWYCGIVTHDSVANTLSVEVNGVSDSTAYSSGSYNGTGLFGIGANMISPVASFFDGRMDNVCIAKSAAGGGGVLSAAQRSAFYAAGVGTEVIAT